MNKLSILVIPEWITTPLNAVSSGRSVLTNSEKLMNILSKDDVAFYVVTNYGFLNNSKEEIGQTFELHPATRELQNQLDGNSLLRIRTEFGYKDTPESYLSFIMKQGANGCSCPADATYVGFDVIGYDMDAVLLQPKAVNYKDLHQCYDALFKLLHDFMPMHEIAKLPVFKIYESQLQSKVAA